MLMKSTPTKYMFVALAALFFLCVQGCTSATHGTGKFEEFGSSDMFSRSFPGTSKAGCEAARRALLSQGYVINDWSTTAVKGRRKFQGDGDIHMEVEFNITCVANSKGSNSVTVFANAVRDRYSLKKSSTNASVGVGAIGSVSLPFGSTDDSLVKVASETIANESLYQRFFELIERYLDDSAVDTDTNSAINKAPTTVDTPPDKALTP